VLEEKVTTKRNKEMSIPRDLTEAEWCDLQLLEMGVLAPLTTYMNREEYHSSLLHHTLPSGAVMPIPIALHVSAKDFWAGSQVSLRWKGRSVATLIMATSFPVDFLLEVKMILGETVLTVEESVKLPHHYCTDHLASILKRFGQDAVYVTGPICFHFQEPLEFSEYRLLPVHIKAMAAEKGSLVAFQTRNPLHRAHIGLIARAAEGRPVLLQPTVGPTQKGDIPAQYRMECYKAVLHPLHDLVKNTVGLCVIPLAMRMAGPREALWHSVLRQNYGFTHFIVGRDHAGPSTRHPSGKSWYEPDAAVKLCLQFQDRLSIKILPGEELVYVPSLTNYLPASEAKEKSLETASISGSALREMLQKNQSVPGWLSYPQVISILRQVPSYQPRTEEGFCIQFTGLPGSGKSALAETLRDYFNNTELKRRAIILDGDVLRNYFKDLGFDRASRSTQTKRIGFLASLLVEHGAIVLCANIAPYDEDRLVNRALLGDKYIEIHVDTSLSVCESRDPKGMYKKARAGLIQNFTGIDDPFERPSCADLTVCTDGETVTDTSKKILKFLVDRANVGK